MRHTIENKAHEYAWEKTCAYYRKKPGSPLNEFELNHYEILKSAWIDGRRGVWRFSEQYTPKQLAKREYGRTYYQKHKERIKAKARAYHQEHKEEINRKRREAHAKKSIH